MRRCSLSFFLPVFICEAWSSNPDSSRINTFRRFDFLYANDVYNGTDRYLTQYIQLKFSSPLRRTETGKLLQEEYLLQQNVYTPSDIFGDTVQVKDRPYSSLLFAGYRRNHYNESRTQLWYWQGGLGIIGRHGFGEDMQREIHYAVDSRQALGWQYQLSNAPFIQIQAGMDKPVLTRRHLDYVLSGMVQAGSVFDDAGLGQTLRIHLNDPYMNIAEARSIRLYAEMRNNVKLVAYNGTLQGAIGSRHNPYVLDQSQVSPLVSLTQFSLSVAYRRLGLTVSQSFLSKEFTTGLKHRWGHIVLSYFWK